jgi:hypothetical protein
MIWGGIKIVNVDRVPFHTRSLSISVQATKGTLPSIPLASCLRGKSGVVNPGETQDNFASTIIDADVSVPYSECELNYTVTLGRSSVNFTTVLMIVEMDGKLNVHHEDFVYSS